MKNLRTIYVLVSVFIILALFVIFLELPSKDGVFTGGRSFLKGFDPNQIKKLEILRIDKPIILEKKEEWMVIDGDKEYLADQENIDSLLTKMSEWEKAELASKNVEKHDIFEVSEEKGLHIVVTNLEDQEIANFWVGKASTSWQSQYVRIQGADEVLLVQEPIKFLFDKPINEFRDKTILKFEAEKVSLLAVKTPEEKVVLKKVDNSWIMTEPLESKADGSKISDAVQALANLKAAEFGQKFVESAGYGVYGLEEAEAYAKIYIEFEDGGSSVLFIGAHKEDKVMRYARVEGNETIFLINQSIFNKFVLKSEDLVMEGEEEEEEETEEEEEES